LIGQEWLGDGVVVRTPACDQNCGGDRPSQSVWGVKKSERARVSNEVGHGDVQRDVELL
jgi:hypothetical protein